MWQLLRDKKALREAIQKEKEASRPDETMLAGFRAALKETNDGIRLYGKGVAPSKELDPPRDPNPNDRNAGGYNANRPSDGLLAKIR